MFKFDFDFPSSGNTSDSNSINRALTCSNDNNDTTVTSSPPQPLNIMDCQDHLDNLKMSPSSWNSDEIAISKSSSLRRISISEKPLGISSPVDDEIGSLQAQKNDLIPGYYEGGLKVWECSIDLCSYLSDQMSHFRNSSSLGEKNVIHHAFSDDGFTLELGCGHGLPAVVILKEIVRRHSKHSDQGPKEHDIGGASTCDGGFNASRSTINDMDCEEGNMNAACHINNSCSATPSNSPSVIFTDYNSFVLRDVTLPNIILNTFDENEMENVEEMKTRLKEHTSLVSGDWLELSKQLKLGLSVQNMPKNGKFDLILASETTYTPKAAQDTAYWLCNHLKPDTGVGLIATKRYYFGVGGGSDEFKNACRKEKLLCSNDGNSYCLSIELVQQYNDGKSNIRDLWKVKCIRCHGNED